ALPGVRYEMLFSYDANGNRVRVDVQNRDETGTVQPNAYFTTIYEYDTLNRLMRTTRESGDYSGAIPGTPQLPTGTGLPDSEFIRTEYQYDANRNRILERSGEAVEGRQPDNVIQYQYDERNRPYRQTRSSGADHSTTQTDYDGNGNRVTTYEGLESAPRTTIYQYDGFNRSTSITDDMGNVTPTHTDANGNRVSTRVDGELTDGPGSGGNVRMVEGTYIYDAMDRVTREDAAHFDAQTQAPIGDGLRTTTMVYTANSQLLSTTNDNHHT